MVNACGARPPAELTPVYNDGVNPKIDTEDLIDAAGVAEILGLARRTSVSVYQRRYANMPRPVVDLGPGRPRLWSRKAIELWGQTSSPGVASATVAEELAPLPQADRGGPMSHYRAVYQMVRRAALGPNPEGLPQTREFAHGHALEAAQQIDPTFVLPPPQSTRYVDTDGRVHELIVTGRENTGVVFAPAGLVHGELRLDWVKRKYPLTRTGGVSGDPVFKPSRIDWIMHVDNDGRLLPSDSPTPWYSVFLQNQQPMAQVLRQRVPGPTALDIGQDVEFWKDGHRVIGFVVDFDDTQVRVKLSENATNDDTN